MHTCQKCSQSFKELASFITHIKSEHNLNLVKYRKKYRSTILEKKYHQCKICDKSLAHMDLSLREHFKKIHNLSVREYFDLHIAGDSGKGSKYNQSPEDSMHFLQDTLSLLQNESFQEKSQGSLQSASMDSERPELEQEHSGSHLNLADFFN